MKSYSNSVVSPDQVREAVSSAMGQVMDEVDQKQQVEINKLNKRVVIVGVVALVSVLLHVVSFLHLV